MSTTVLLTEHEPATQGLLERQLRDDGFELALPGSAPDLVLAGNDAELERWCGQAPVIVLGPAEAEADERVRAFRRGCDDYLARPSRSLFAATSRGTRRSRGQSSFSQPSTYSPRSTGSSQ